MPDPLYLTPFIYFSVFPTEKTEAWHIYIFEANNSFKLFAALPTFIPLFHLYLMLPIVRPALL